MWAVPSSLATAPPSCQACAMNFRCTMQLLCCWRTHIPKESAAFQRPVLSRGWLDSPVLEWWHMASEPTPRARAIISTVRKDLRCVWICVMKIHTRSAIQKRSDFLRFGFLGLEVLRVCRRWVSQKILGTCSARSEPGSDAGSDREDHGTR